MALAFNEASWALKVSISLCKEWTSAVWTSWLAAWASLRLVHLEGPLDEEAWAAGCAFFPLDAAATLGAGVEGRELGNED